MNNSVDDAEPAKYFNLPPYRAELFNEQSGWAGVMNKSGTNCLTFKSKPGAVITDFETACLIAKKWNYEK